MKTPDPLVEFYRQEIKKAIQFYALEMATLRRIKESSPSQEIKEIITGIIMDELTLINHYRSELL